MERLTRRADFRAVARGRRAISSAFVLQSRARADQGTARVGFTVSRQVGNAVERNRVRRRLREIVRLVVGEMLDGHDYVLIGRRPALAVPFAQMRQELDAALTQIHSASLRASGSAQGTGGAGIEALHQAGSRPPRPPRRRNPCHV